MHNELQASLGRRERQGQGTTWSYSLPAAASAGCGARLPVSERLPWYYIRVCGSAQVDGTTQGPEFCRDEEITPLALWSALNKF